MAASRSSFAFRIPGRARAGKEGCGRRCDGGAQTWEDAEPAEPHVWRTLGYRRVRQGGGESVLEWDAPREYAFSAPSGPIIHGGLVATFARHRDGWRVLVDARGRRRRF
jgi:hypothetical protein